MSRLVERAEGGDWGEWRGKGGVEVEEVRLEWRGAVEVEWDPLRVERVATRLITKQLPY